MSRADDCSARVPCVAKRVLSETWRCRTIGTVLVAALLLVTGCSGNRLDVASYGSRLQGASVERTATPLPTSRPPAALRALTPRSVDRSSGGAFDVGRAMADIRALTAIGVRRAGSARESQAATWIASRLREMGYEPTIQTFHLPDGRTSHNVTALAAGKSKMRIILGAHIDSKAPSPGANDNASGVGILLEVARLLAETPSSTTVEIDFFGAEEISDGNPDHHHAGSRYRASVLSADERAQTVAMLSVDMASFGTKAYARNMRRGPMSFANEVVDEGKRLGLPITYLRDPGRSGWSDHEPFELLGIPSAWLEWLEDPAYHTARDTAGRLSTAVVRRSGELVLALARAQR